MSAVFSPDRVYRYKLWRQWGDEGGFVCFVLLNPSTADETSDDPTVRRCTGYTSAWGYSKLAVVNLFAFRATDPQAMKAARDPVGTGNDWHILDSAQRADVVVCAWGQHGTYRGRSGEVRQMLMSAGVKLHCLRRSKSGQPAHPLYLPAHLSPVEF